MIDFTKLTKRQLEVFEQIAVNNDAGHPTQTLKSLEGKGLIESEEQIVGSRGEVQVKIKRYFVPAPVHIAWCEWCASLPDEESAE